MLAIQTLNSKIVFTLLSDIKLDILCAHMSDPRVGAHMPLLRRPWTLKEAAQFVDAKQKRLAEDGLGHWAFLADGIYVGWGGFQKEAGEWDYGLVLRPDYFGLGSRITRASLAFAKSDPRIPYVTFLLPPSRRNLRGLERLGASLIGEVNYKGAVFLKYKLSTV